MTKQWSIITITLTNMKAEVGMKFYDSISGVHEITKIENGGFLHTYKAGKKTIEGFMYDVAFERLLNANAICVL